MTGPITAAGCAMTRGCRSDQAFPRPARLPDPRPVGPGATPLASDGQPGAAPAGWSRAPAVPRGLSVIIPTLDAARTLPATVGAVLGAPVTEIIVADGGSGDGTQAVADRLGARLIRSPRGRGAQLAAGIAAARGDWLLLLHADTRLAPEWQGAALAFMDAVDARARNRGASGRAGPDLRAAHFRFALDGPEPQARRLERAVAWRCRVLALPYGDQGLLLPRALLEEAGGMRALPLMEDVDLVRRIGRRRLVALDAAAVTSAARWRRDGWLRRSARNLACLALWRAGVPARLVARLYG